MATTENLRRTSAVPSDRVLDSPARRRAARTASLAVLPLETVGPDPGFVGGLRSAVRGVVEYREMLGLLVRRELKARYKDSSLGFLWSLLRPLTTLIVYYVAIGKFLQAERNTPEFAIYLFSGLTIWMLFQEIIASGTGSILGNAGLIKKVYLPREVFPLAAVGSSLFNFVTQLAILLAAVVLTGFPTGERWLYAPMSLLIVLTWGLGLSLMLSALNVYLRDVQYLVEIVLMTLFWASPVVYPWKFVADALPGWAEQIYLANPVTAAVLGMQKTFWLAGDTAGENGSMALFPADHLTRMGIMVLVGLVLIVVGQRVFARLQADFAQEL